jgi:putative endonuclease
MVGVVYFMTNKKLGTLYVRVTSNLPRRAWEHRNGIVPGFTSKYGSHLLVYFEVHDRIASAIQREHNIKHWPRRWKVELIESLNPEWDDLYSTLI